MYFITTKRMLEVCFSAHPNIQYRTFLFCRYVRFLYKGIIIKHNKTEPTYTKTSLFLCEKRRFFMARTEKGGKVFLVSQAGRSGFFHFKTRRIANGR